MELHQTIGNRAVQGMIESGTLQLEANSIQPADIYSQEINHLIQRVESRFAPQKRLAPASYDSQVYSSTHHPPIPGRDVAQKKEWSRGELDGKKTDVTWRTSTLEGDTVGVDMTANPLGPEHLQGSPPQSGEQNKLMGKLPTDPGLTAESKFIRGHLLNDNLGGPGVDFNLYPITADANKQHHDRIEKPVKEWVNDEKQWVKYEVFAVQRPDNWYDSVFECQAQVLNPDTLQPDGPKITAHIQSTYESKRGEYNEVEVEEGSLHPKGEEAENYTPLLSTAKRYFKNLDGDLQASLIYCFYQYPDEIAKALGEIKGIGATSISVLEELALDEDFSNPNEKQRGIISRIGNRDVDVLGAIASVVFQAEEEMF
jgi:hypothetical protein